MAGTIYTILFMIIIAALCIWALYYVIRAAVRAAMQAEREAGHWADPSIDDDRHDETSLFGRGEPEEYEDDGVSDAGDAGSGRAGSQGDEA